MKTCDKLGEVGSGTILWLPADAQKSSPRAFKKSGLPEEATDRPVVVLDDLAGKHDFVWILLVGTPLQVQPPHTDQ